MRGIHPPPADVCHLRQSFDIGGRSCSVGFWLFAPSFAGAGDTALADVLAGWFAICLDQFLELQHEGVIPTACQVSIRGLSLVEAAPPAHGAWSGGQAINAALGMRWQTSEPGRAGWALTFVPGVPDVFVADNWRLTQLAWGNLQASARDLLNNLNALPAPDGSSCVVGTVHVVAHGAPIAVPSFAPYVGVSGVPKLVTIRRRVPDAGGISPF